MVKEQAKQVLADSSLREARRETDTVKLWESYREQALLWRALALLQIPITALALIVALVMYSNRETILNVPAKPLPGFYSANEIPDAEFLSVATEFVNLIATYQPTVARRQFEEAARLLSGDMLQKFETQALEQELAAIENTRRTQIFFADPTKTRLFRSEQPGADNTVEVLFAGDRSKYIGEGKLPVKYTLYRVTMTTVPRNTLNPYGIVVTNVVQKGAKSGDLEIGEQEKEDE